MKQPSVHSNSEKKIENPNFKLKIGTTNCVKPEVIYIEGKTFITPIDEKSDYSDDIKAFKHHFRQSIQRMLNSNEKLFDKSKYILEFDVATNGIMIKKKSFLTIQLLLKQKQMMKLKDISDHSASVINDMMNDLSKKMRESNYEVNKNKC